MTKKTKWSHLPNAAHIDHVLASVKAHPNEWSAAWYMARDAAYYAVYYAARDAARDMARDMAWDMAWDMARGAARDMAQYMAWSLVRAMAREEAYDMAYKAAREAAPWTAWGSIRQVILALFAYDDCAHYLDMPSDQLCVWAILSENPAANLLLPAVVAFEKISLLEELA